MCLFPVVVKNKRKSSALESLDQIGFSEQWLNEAIENLPDTYTVPCGQCVECLRDNAQDWAYRSAIEAKKYSDNCMITLTYAKTDGNLCKRDAQLFFKRLRKNGVKCRYFGCGEYGSKGLRPHYHFVIFGYVPPDLEFFYIDKSGIPVYKSDFISKVWGLGFISVTKGFDMRASIYASLYLQKSEFQEQDIRGKVKPFRMMSRCPGIGGNSLKFCSLETDKIYIQGKYRRLPRYIVNKFLEYGYDISDLKEKRKIKSDIFARCSSPNDLEFRKKKSFDFFLKYRKNS